MSRRPERVSAPKLILNLARLTTPLLVCIPCHGAQYFAVMSELGGREEKSSRNFDVALYGQGALGMHPASRSKRTVFGHTTTRRKENAICNREGPCRMWKQMQTMTKVLRACVCECECVRVVC